MSKTIAGFVLVGGLIVCVAGMLIGSVAATAKSTPATDWYYELWQYAGFGIAIVGICLFFFGALRFARG